MSPSFRLQALRDSLNDLWDVIEDQQGYADEIDGILRKMDTDLTALIGHPPAEAFGGLGRQSFWSQAWPGF